jgi:hypothetical protein
MNLLSSLLANWPAIAMIGDNFPTSGKRLGWHDLWAYGVVALVAGAVAAVVILLRNRNDMTKRCDNPAKLFRELCMVHALDGASQRLLTQLAKVRNFEQPAQVFVTPAAFEPATLPPHLRDKAEHLARLRNQLFW